MNALVSESFFLLRCCRMVNALDNVELILNTLPNFVNCARKKCDNPYAGQVGNVCERMLIFRLLGVFGTRCTGLLCKACKLFSAKLDIGFRLVIASARMSWTALANSWYKSRMRLYCSAALLPWASKSKWTLSAEGSVKG